MKAGTSIVCWTGDTPSSRRRRPGCPCRIPSVREDVGEGPGAVAGLAREAEVLEQVAPHGEGRRSGHAVALVAHQDRRVIRPARQQERLLEPGVEPGQIGEVGAVLAVGIDDEPVIAALRRPGPQSLQPRPGRPSAGISGISSGMPNSGSQTAVGVPVSLLNPSGPVSSGDQPRPPPARWSRTGRRPLIQGPTRRPATAPGSRLGSAVPSPKWIHPSCPPA